MHIARMCVSSHDVVAVCMCVCLYSFINIYRSLDGNPLQTISDGAFNNLTSLQNL